MRVATRSRQSSRLSARPNPIYISSMRYNRITGCRKCSSGAIQMNVRLFISQRSSSVGRLLFPRLINIIVSAATTYQHINNLLLSWPYTIRLSEVACELSNLVSPPVGRARAWLAECLEPPLHLPIKHTGSPQLILGSLLALGSNATDRNGRYAFAASCKARGNA
jgi:hypothetical protein